MMHPFLAQLENVPDSSLKNAVLICAGGLACLYYAKEIFMGGKKKREVSFEFTPASKEEFDGHVRNNKAEHEQLFSKMGGIERGLRGEFTAEIKTVRSEMTETVRQLAALNTNAELLNQAMSAERARLDREIERRRET